MRRWAFVVVTLVIDGADGALQTPNRAGCRNQP